MLLPTPKRVPDAVLRDVLRSHSGGVRIPLDVLASIGEQWQRVVRTNRGNFLIEVVDACRIDERGMYALHTSAPSDSEEEEEACFLKLSDLGKLAFEELTVNVGKRF